MGQIGWTIIFQKRSNIRQNRMKPDQLYLIRRDFQDQGKTYYCPGCAEMIGLLEYYPELKKGIEIHEVDFARPRPMLVSLLGEANQGCPVLVLGTCLLYTSPSPRD